MPHLFKPPPRSKKQERAEQRAASKIPGFREVQRLGEPKRKPARRRTKK